MNDYERRFDIGRVLSKTFRVIRRRGLILMGIGLVIMLPLLLVYWLLFDHFVVMSSEPPIVEPGDSPDLNTTWDWFANTLQSNAIFAGGTMLTEIFLLPIVTAFAVFVTFRGLRNEPVNLSECLGYALQRLPRLLVVSLIVSFGVGIGSLFCCLPGIALYGVWFVAAPVAVVENAGILQSLNRSYELCKPRFWYVCILLVVVFIMSIVVGSASAIAGLMDKLELSLLFNWIARVVFITILAVAQSVTYHDLRAESEGLGKDDLPQIFE